MRFDVNQRKASIMHLSRIFSRMSISKKQKSQMLNCRLSYRTKLIQTLI